MFLLSFLIILLLLGATMEWVGFIPPFLRMPMGVAINVYTILIYLASNHFPLRTPQVLEFGWVDYQTPFLPWTFWIYVSDYVLVGLSYLLLMRDNQRVNAFGYAYLFLQTFGVACFVFFPTIYPRQLFPLSESLDPITLSWFTQFRLLDSPTNCAPSLHVGTCYLSALVFRNYRPKVYYAFLVWATLIAFSTLTTKQHYFFDVVTGAILALGFYWLFHFKIKVREWNPLVFPSRFKEHC